MRPSPQAPLALALAQTRSIPGDVEANVRTSASTIARAAERGTHLVVFPELSLTGYELEILRTTPAAWLTENDARLDPVRRACKAHGITAVLGAPVRTADGRRVLGAPIVGPDGDRGVSIKEHLHGAEATVFQAGAPIPPFDVHGWRVAVGICFDVAFPRHAEGAAQDGADLYVASAFYGTGAERRIDLHLGARAMDNRIFTGLANYAGTTGGFVSCGTSGAWDPAGDVLARVSGDDEALAVVELDPTKLHPYRTG